MAVEWTQAEAILLCKFIEALAPEYGCHVALTGGLLYKSGPRKDCDIVLYRIRQAERIEADGLFSALEAVGLELKAPLPNPPKFVTKATWRGKSVDIFIPETPSGNYDEPADDDPDDEAPL